MTFEEFVETVNAHEPTWDRPPWRKGQTAFNTLYMVCPELAKAITGTDVDPFYLDSRLPAFYEFVGSHWTDYNPID